MKIRKYRTEIKEGLSLVKESVTEYQEEKLDTPEKVYQMLCNLYKLDRQSEEHVYMLAYDAKSLIGVFEVSHGTIDGSYCSPKDVYKRAMLCNALSIIVCHNHPSGNCTPSMADMETQRTLEEAGKLLGIKLLDFIIAGNKQFYSFQTRESKFVGSRLISLSTGNGMGDDLIIFETNAPQELLKELEKESCEIYKQDSSEVPIWADVVEEKGYKFNYISHSQNVTPYGTSSSWKERNYPYVTEQYWIE